VPLFLLHRRYERHCRSCGHAREVSRAIAGMNPPAIVAMNESDPRGSGSDSLYEARLEEYEATRRCPSCGADDFEQRPLKTQK
jgi:rubredoxin